MSRTLDDQIVDAILRREGGYVNNPVDRGGCTNRGITIRTLEEWRGHDVTCEDVKAMTEDEARAIYMANYVRPFDQADPALKPHLVDIAVNSGVSRARQLLMRAEAQTQRPVWLQLVVERLKLYAQIVRANPSQVVFFQGWVNRALEFLDPPASPIENSHMDTGSDIPNGGAAQ
jgi:lysozyme family protein